MQDADSHGKTSGQRGQSSVEWALLVVLVAAAIISMGVYVRRAIEGRLRETGDTIGEPYYLGRTEGQEQITVSSPLVMEVVTNEPTGPQGAPNQTTISTSIPESSPEVTTRTGQTTFVEDVRAPLLDR